MCEVEGGVCEVEGVGCVRGGVGVCVRWRGWGV